MSSPASTIAAPPCWPDMPNDLDELNEGIWRLLEAQYEKEAPMWTLEMCSQVIQEVSNDGLRVRPSNIYLCGHKYCTGWRTRKTTTVVTFGKVWILRGLYGALACSKYHWFWYIIDLYPIMRQGANCKAVPPKALSLLESGKPVTLALTFESPKRSLLKFTMAADTAPSELGVESDVQVDQTQVSTPWNSDLEAQHDNIYSRLEKMIKTADKFATCDELEFYLNEVKWHLEQQMDELKWQLERHMYEMTWQLEQTNDELEQAKNKIDELSRENQSLFEKLEKEKKDSSAIIWRIERLEKDMKYPKWTSNDEIVTHVAPFQAPKREGFLGMSAPKDSSSD